MCVECHQVLHEILEDWSSIGGAFLNSISFPLFNISVQCLNLCVTIDICAYIENNA